jgi:ribonuclease-3
MDYKFKNTALFDLAMLHPSLKKRGNLASYERLEFLGDRVIGLIIAEMLYKKFPSLDEGKLAVAHSMLVRSETLAKIAMNLKLDKKVRMDISEERNKGRANKNNLEDVIEALLGAIYLDGGFDCAKAFIEVHWADFVTDDIATMQRDPKSLLQEWAQQHGKPIPVYTLTKQTGKAHSPFFSIEVFVEGFEPCAGCGKNKKEAQLNAATALLERISKGDIK